MPVQLVLEGWPSLTKGLLLPTACPRRGRQEPEPTAGAGLGTHAAGLLTDWTRHVKRETRAESRGGKKGNRGTGDTHTHTHTHTHTRQRGRQKRAKERDVKSKD
jgi:hypothetical protein